MADAESITVTPEQAQQHVKAITDLAGDEADAHNALFEAIKLAWTDKHHEALGLTWAQYTYQHLNPALGQVEAARRRKWIPELHLAGMAERMIADLTGVSQPTVNRDLKRAESEDESANHESGDRRKKPENPDRGVISVTYTKGQRFTITVE